MSSLGKCPHDETPITGPSQCPCEEPEQSRRDDPYLYFNDREDEEFFSDPDEPKTMAQIVKAQTPA
jgi:hypothetical protein